jgi:hypothetical protein
LTYHTYKTHTFLTLALLQQAHNNWTISSEQNMPVSYVCKYIML